MVFSSITFLGIFLPIFLILYFLSKKRSYRNTIIILFSLIFYGWGEPVWILGMLALTFVDYLLAKILHQLTNDKAQRMFLVFTVFINLLMLFILKYYNFFAQNLNSIASLKLPLISAQMPIGISFFTFQALTYVIDVYRKKAEPQKKYSHVLLYISMFPQLIAGPIVRYADVENQILNRTETREGFLAGMLHFSIGLGKKVILANYAGLIVTTLLKDSHVPELSTAGAWLGMIMFSCQLYFDFSGYSDMAIGLGKMLGFEYKKNFDYPYISKNVTDFWKRWHISLSSFFRDYVYIPLGGNRKHQSINLMIVWLLTGLWHGASWNFVLWGMYFFLLLLIEKWLNKFEINMGNIPIIGNLLLLLIALMGWSIFYFTDLHTLGLFFQSLFGLTNRIKMEAREATPMYQYFFLILIMLPGCTPLPKKIACALFPEGKTRTQIASCLFTCSLLCICYLMLLKQTYNPFMYFRF